MVVGLFTRAPSRLGAVPSTQNTVLPLLVSHTPMSCPVLLRLSKRRYVTVRPPLALNIAVSVPSGAPSAPSARCPCPTRSRCRPLKATVSEAIDPPAVKEAVVVTGVLPTRVQVSVPPHPPPDHPAKVDPGAGVAVSVTTFPARYV